MAMFMIEINDRDSVPSKDFPLSGDGADQLSGGANPL